MTVTTINQFVSLIRDVCENGWDAVIAVSGKRGVGKSTFCVQFLKEWSGTYNPVRDMPFSREELMDMIDNKPRFAGIHVDEAVGLLFSRNWNDPNQIALLQKLDRSRHNNQTILVAMPRFRALDSHFRNSDLGFWVHVYKRTKGLAYALVFQADDNPASEDVWNLKEVHKQWIKNSIQRHHLYRGEIIFKPMTKQEEELYEKVKRLKRNIIERSERFTAKKKKRLNHDKYKQFNYRS